MGYTYSFIDQFDDTALQFLDVIPEKGEFLEIGRAPDYDRGMDLVLDDKPDLLFIRTEEHGSLQALVNEFHQYLTELPVMIAVSTKKGMAYSAIKLGFFDLLLLPFQGSDVNKTLRRLLKAFPIREESPTLCLKSYSDFHYLKTDDILYLKADNNTTDFHMRNGKIISAYKTLKSYEQALPENFMRVHQSYIINSDYVSRINYGKNQCSIRDLEPLPFSRSYKPKVDQLKELLTKNAIRTMS